MEVENRLNRAEDDRAAEPGIILSLSVFLERKGRIAKLRILPVHSGLASSRVTTAADENPTDNGSRDWRHKLSTVSMARCSRNA